MPSDDIERLKRGEQFASQYKEGIKQILAKLSTDKGIDQELLLKAFNEYSHETKIKLQDLAKEGITFRPVFTGPFYAMINGQDDVVKVQVQTSSGKNKEIEVNPRLLFWNNTSPIHTHIAPKDLTAGEALCAFFLAGGSATEAKFSLAGTSENKDFVYDANVKKVTTAKAELTVDRYNFDSTKPQQLAKIYTHQFVPQEATIPGIYVLDSNGVHNSVKAITANIYNGVQPDKPAHSQKVQDISPQLTKQAFTSLGNLKSRMENLDPAKLKQLGVTGFEKFTVRVRISENKQPLLQERAYTKLLKSKYEKDTSSDTNDLNTKPKSHREKIASKDDSLIRI